LGGNHLDIHPISYYNYFVITEEVFMKINIVKIGNSKGIRIPKKILEHCEISKSVDLKIEGNQIVLTPDRSKPRKGWAAAAEKMHNINDDELLMPDVFKEDIEVEW
jgi:antitoxin MazE